MKRSKVQGLAAGIMIEVAHSFGLGSISIDEIMMVQRDVPPLNARADGAMQLKTSALRPEQLESHPQQLLRFRWTPPLVRNPESFFLREFLGGNVRVVY